MPESLIGRWYYVCNCGPECDCGHRSDVPSECPCGHPAALRRVLAEDEHYFYVAETGQDGTVRNELHHDKAFVSADGKPLQGFRKAWRKKPTRVFMYRGMEVKLSEYEQECTVSVGGKQFSAMRHGDLGRWMGFPCYTMFETAEKFARDLVDNWDIIGNDAILAPPREEAQGAPGGPGPAGRGPAASPTHGHGTGAPPPPPPPVEGGGSERGGRGGRGRSNG